MELKNYLQILIRWLWLLFLCILLGIGGGYMASRLQTPTYQASTKILISKDVLDQNSRFASLNNQQLIDAYVQMLTSTSVIDETSRRLNYAIDLKDLGAVQQVQSTNVIEITMEDSDPKRAAAIINMMVEVLIEQNAQPDVNASTEEYLKNKITQVEGQITTLQNQIIQISDEKLNSQLKQINDQIATVQAEIGTVQAETETVEADIAQLNTEIEPLATSRLLTVEQTNQLFEKRAKLAQLQSRLPQVQSRLNQLQSRLNQYQEIRTNLDLVGKPALNSSELGGDVRLQQLQTTLDNYQKTYLELSNNLQAVQLTRLQNTPATIDQIEKAIPPILPIRPQPIIYMILGGIVGLFIAIGVLFITEYYLDDTLKTPDDVQQVFGAPVLGYIPNMQPASKTSQGLPVAGQLHAQPSEALDALRANLELTVAHCQLKTLLILDVNELGKGKTNMAADLAFSYAQSGSRVVLLDANLRNPSIHTYFGLVNEVGFCDLLMDDSKTMAAVKKVASLDKMTVITGGNASPTSYRLLKPEKIVAILETLEPQSDVIIVDTPPISEANSWMLASKVDGVLLTIQPKTIHKASAEKTVEKLNLADAKIIGVALYRIPRNLTFFYRSIRYHFRPFRINLNLQGGIIGKSQ